jgi:hypothetical protein
LVGACKQRIARELREVLEEINGVIQEIKPYLDAIGNEEIEHAVAEAVKVLVPLCLGDAARSRVAANDLPAVRNVISRWMRAVAMPPENASDGEVSGLLELLQGLAGKRA